MKVWIVAALTAVAASMSGAAADTPRKSLAPGGAKFWSGPRVDSASSGGGCEEGSCWEYELEVTKPAYRLRVGFDHPEVGDDFSITVTDPSGSQSTMRPGTGLYSAESRHENPETGVWTIRVQAVNVSDSAFRLRAKLEARPPGLGVKEGEVLPNLQMLPPHEASFLMPITNGSQGDPPQGAEGGDSCHPEEHAEDGAVRCLRFAFGIRNTGRGPMQLYFDGAPPDDHPLFQRVVVLKNGDLAYRDYEVGVARYHESHAHYHHNDAAEVQLYSVTDRKTGEMTAAGEPRTKGFAHRNELLRDWRHFYPTWDNSFGFGLLAGWADIYEWDRPGNYVDFGLNGDGYYVVRMRADPIDGVRESNEKDNFGYTYLQVTGSDVELVEAGRGKHPWDPCKIVVGFGGHPDPKPESPRPKSCPRDTT